MIYEEKHIFSLTFRAQEVDAYPLGALPIGTKVHCIEQTPGFPYHKIRAAGTYGTILVSYIFSKKKASSFEKCFIFC